MKKLVTPVIALGLLMSASPAFAYTVQPGDTLSQIAVDNNITLSELVNLNPQITDPNRIFVDDVIKTTPDVANPTVVSQPKRSDDLDVLSRIVEAEAGDEPYAGKVAVAETVMNRVANPEFPDSVRGVVYEHGQFSPVANGTINNVPSAESIRAAESVLSTYKPDPNGTLYFYAPRYTHDQWMRNRTTVEKIGSQIFSK